MISLGIGIPFGRRGGGFTAEYKAILDRATVLGYPLPTIAQQVKDNELVKAMIAGGIWSRLDRFYNHFTDNNASQFSTLNWINPLVSQATLFNSPTFTNKLGFTGNGTSSYISYNTNLSTLGGQYVQNDACLGGYFSNVSGANTRVLNANLARGNIFQSSSAFNGINSSNIVNPASTMPASGLMMHSRELSASYNRYGNGLLETVAQVSTANLPTALEVMRDAFGSFSSITASMVFAGKGLNSQEATFRTIINAYIASL